MVAIPVFPSRMFRHSAFYVRRGGPVRTPEDLAGRKIGIPEWSQTATIYARGWLMHEIGIPLDRVEWYQAGVNEPGRVEMAHLKLPKGVRCTGVPDRSLTDLLLAGDIDAMISAHPPDAFEEGHPDIVRLIPDYRAQEEAYFRKTRIYPIMHTVAIRRDVYDANPWIAMNLVTAFEEAKRRSMARIMEMTASQIAVPWLNDYVQGLRAVFGDDHFPYGIEPNRPTLEAFLTFCHEQGVCHRLLRPEDLFPKSVQSVFRI